ncbi:Type II secretion system subunit [Elusimicrobium minutum Pei191]|uniref:Type II secretion system subunit n=1 Tax=Elusimicrobium minutum (strain Pei191) TaxID=445932 RepID=B2KBT1_ELUMP|nr:prepilin-type N-terminal cleavage/methylation domain-containing protein [Elusimicrobium minutum]ACC97835.1 Type II secretion system subunit [Elusimicrobium minutum Pei191]
MNQSKSLSLIPSCTAHFSKLLNNRAFTLIELLVVVLIIGILAAIALPMYTKAVDKSKAVEAIGIVKNFSDANQRYLLEYGVCAPSADDLDIDLNIDTNKYTVTYSIADHCRFEIKNKKNGLLIMAYGGSYAAAQCPNGDCVYCKVSKNSTYLISLCKTFGPLATEGTYLYYRIR